MLSHLFLDQQSQLADLPLPPPPLPLQGMTPLLFRRPAPPLGSAIRAAAGFLTPTNGAVVPPPAEEEDELEEEEEGGQQLHHPQVEIPVET